VFVCVGGDVGWMNKQTRKEKRVYLDANYDDDNQYKFTLVALCRMMNSKTKYFAHALIVVV